MVYLTVTSTIDTMPDPLPALVKTRSNRIEAEKARDRENGKMAWKGHVETDAEAGAADDDSNRGKATKKGKRLTKQELRTVE